ncbi:MAG: ABC transporter substrate-binding protein [Alphaproteobacteria bacterium]|nr:ABC transporter substrate-binding protein [Alphaproteobacteria bacterium]
MIRRTVAALAAAAVLTLPASGALAEAKEVRIAKQFGLGYLQFFVMEDQKLVEKHAKEAGLGDVQTTWAQFRSSDVMNDALISGSVDFVCLGVPGIATIWAKTRGNIDVRAVSGLNQLPLFLLTRNPAVKTLKDFTEKDRIALPAVKVSMQAMLLQMAAAKEFGDANVTKFDALTISMAHPDATAAMLGGPSEITSSFSSPPFQFRQLKNPAIRKLSSSTEILGGPSSFNVIAATAKFRADNPKLYAAFLGALEEATNRINADKKWAAELYLRAANDKTPLDEMLAMMNDPSIAFTLKAQGIAPFVDFMLKTGAIKVAGAKWQDLFFPDAKGLN